MQRIRDVKDCKVHTYKNYLSQTKCLTMEGAFKMQEVSLEEGKMGTLSCWHLGN